MAYVSYGDLAQAYSTRRDFARLKALTDIHSKELVTGSSADVAKRLRGNYSQLSEIETILRTLDSYRTASTEAAFFASAMQASLEAIQGCTTSASSNLLISAGSDGQTQIQSMATDAKAKFKSVVSALNTQVGGRSVFAGDKTDMPAVIDANTMLNDLGAAIAGETTADGVTAAIDDWFNLPGGGFETAGYIGSDTPLAPQRIGEGEQADISITAADPAIRNTLKAFAMAALATDGPLDGNTAEQSALLRKAGEGLISANAQQTQLRADIGESEAYIETISTQNSAEKSALEMFRSDILSVDPYEAATKLKAVQTQLETMYTLTARMSRLSLMDFLR